MVYIEGNFERNHFKFDSCLYKIDFNFAFRVWPHWYGKIEIALGCMGSNTSDVCGLEWDLIHRKIA